jgi:drug/metabolite transporter (DMT)-like permease
MTFGAGENKKMAFWGILAAIAASIFSCFYMPFTSLLMNQGIGKITVGAWCYASGSLAALGVFLFLRLRNQRHPETKPEALLSKKDALPMLSLIIGGTGSAIAIMFALRMANAASVALFSNFEVITTCLVAWIIFKEVIHPRTWVGIAIVTGGCILLGFDFSNGISFSPASLLAFVACLFWSIENNSSRILSDRNRAEVVFIKDLSCSVAMFIVAFFLGEDLLNPLLGWALLIGIFSVGFTSILYMSSQRVIGTAKTSAFFATCPFLASILAIFVLQDFPQWNFYVALAIVLIGQAFVVWDTLANDKNRNGSVLSKRIQ